MCIRDRLRMKTSEQRGPKPKNVKVISLTQKPTNKTETNQGSAFARYVESKTNNEDRLFSASSSKSSSISSLNDEMRKLTSKPFEMKKKRSELSDTSSVRIDDSTEDFFAGNSTQLSVRNESALKEPETECKPAATKTIGIGKKKTRDLTGEKKLAKGGIQDLMLENESDPGDRFDAYVIDDTRDGNVNNEIFNNGAWRVTQVKEKKPNASSNKKSEPKFEPIMDPAYETFNRSITEFQEAKQKQVNELQKYLEGLRDKKTVQFPKEYENMVEVTAGEVRYEAEQNSEGAAKDSEGVPRVMKSTSPLKIRYMKLKPETLELHNITKTEDIEKVNKGVDTINRLDAMLAEKERAYRDMKRVNYQQNLNEVDKMLRNSESSMSEMVSRVFLTEAKNGKSSLDTSITMVKSDGTVLRNDEDKENEISDDDDVYLSRSRMSETFVKEEKRIRFEEMFKQFEKTFADGEDENGDKDSKGGSKRFAIAYDGAYSIPEEDLKRMGEMDEKLTELQVDHTYLGIDRNEDWHEKLQTNLPKEKALRDLAQDRLIKEAQKGFSSKMMIVAEKERNKEPEERWKIESILKNIRESGLAEPSRIEYNKERFDAISRLNQEADSLIKELQKSDILREIDDMRVELAQNEKALKEVLKLAEDQETRLEEAQLLKQKQSMIRAYLDKIEHDRFKVLDMFEKTCKSTLSLQDQRLSKVNLRTTLCRITREYCESLAGSPKLAMKKAAKIKKQRRTKLKIDFKTQTLKSCQSPQSRTMIKSSWRDLD
eukprot:TRINITY_DN5823_c0_g1_i1.p1 TRINITY_DN5823_c0_g1~~TRINITY_DN5823_c0_g1_i1.p1  ORF type:complete len:790 (+),score=143.94 TRINITY_DN5823_c0_g1_i1:61-2370(+)